MSELADPVPPLLRLAEVSFVYPGPPPVEALIDVSLSIAAGEYVSITGPSGSGKSSLLNLLGLLDRPTTGSVELEGVGTAGLSHRALAGLRASAVGFVFQRFHLIPSRSAVQNVELALRYGDIAREDRRVLAGQALATVGLATKQDRRPAELSGGEQQRVAIARAIVRDQKLLLADEPTGNLDSATSTEILDLFDDLAVAGRTIVCVTHSEQVAARSNRRLRVLDGRVTDNRVTRNSALAGGRER